MCKTIKEYYSVSFYWQAGCGLMNIPRFLILWVYAILPLMNPTVQFFIQLTYRILIVIQKFPVHSNAKWFLFMERQMNIVYSEYKSLILLLPVFTFYWFPYWWFKSSLWHMFMWLIFKAWFLPLKIPF